MSEPGYEETIQSGPGPLKELHTHDQSQLVLVLSGKFIMINERGFTAYGPGDWYENLAGTLHTEQFGPQGCKVLLAKK
jgi:hypothetical protein